MGPRGRFFTGAVLASACVGLVVIATTTFSQPKAAAQEQKTLAEIMKRMKYYNKSLGVECDYCHVPNKFDQETPRRKTAKWMQEHLVEGLVTKERSQPIDCHTCHDGRARFLPSSQ